MQLAEVTLGKTLKHELKEKECKYPHKDCCETPKKETIVLNRTDNSYVRKVIKGLPKKHEVVRLANITRLLIIIETVTVF